MRALLVVSAALALAAPGADATRINLGDAFGRVTGLISAAVHSHRDAEQSKAPSSPYKGEYIEFPGLRESHTLSPPAHEWVKAEDLPQSFSWGNINGESFLTRSLNQHVPQYCGSCWAHASMSSLADRVKIARGNTKSDIGFSIQYILNCGAKIAGSCHGGSAVGTYYFIHSTGSVPFDTCLAYEACSSDSTEGHCADPGRDYSCTAMNTCRTCSTFAERGGFCSEVDFYPNATVAEYGRIIGEAAMMAEIYARGPISCSLNAQPLHTYEGGVFNDDDAEKHTNHLISIVGWGVEPTDDGEGLPFWIGRNSWGEYWGELGFFRVARGRNTLGVEQNCAWVTPDSWTEVNTPCYEDGSNCAPQQPLVGRARYIDPSRQRVPAGRLVAARSEGAAAATIEGGRGGGGGVRAGAPPGAGGMLLAEMEA